MTTASPGLETRRLFAALETKLFGEAVDPVKVGRFEVLDRLGEGAMGVVYRARDPGLHREVAVKLIASRFTDEAGATARLRREARALARLEHPNVVKVLDVGSHAGQVFVAMEKVDGGTLLDWCHAHPPGTPRRIVALRSLLDQAAAGLAAAHRAGVVHRDVKPQNMLLGVDGRLRLADFGLASTSVAELPTLSGHDDVNVEGSTSEAGAIVGTPAYMAPEQFDGVADERADQFSLCASFWEAAYGERPFEGTSIVALIRSIGERPRAPTQVRDVPTWLRRVLLRGLSENPSDRYPSLDALRTDLGRRRGRRGAVVLALLGVTGLFVFSATARDDEDRCESPPSDLDRAWDADVQASVHERFVSAVPSDGASAFARVDAGLQAYADAWRGAWSDACVATWRDETQSEALLDARMRCLARAEQAHAAVVNILVDQELDAVMVTRAAAAAESLPAVAACSDPSADDQHALPDDPAVRAEIERRWGQLDALMLFKYAGSIERDIATARDVLTAAQAIGHAPLEVDAALALAEFQIAARDPEAIDVLDRTIRIATEAGLHARAVRCALMQAGADDTFGATGRDRHMAHARAWAQRIEDPADRERATMRVDITTASDLVRDGKYEDAVRVLDPVVRYYEAHRDHEAAFLLMGAYEERGKALLQLSRYEEAERELERALAQREQLPEANVHHEAQIHSMLAQLAFETGRPEAAAEEFAKLLPIVERSLGTRHPAYAATVANLANARLLSGDREGGIAAMRQSMELFAEINPPEHDSHVLVRSNLAHVLRPGAEKMALHREACDLALEHHGADSEVYAIARSMRAEDLGKAGEHAEAIAIARESLAVFERLGKDRKVIDDLVTLSRAHTAIGRTDEALDLAERALEQARTIYGTDGPKTSGPELALAWALHASRRDNEAREALERAQRAANKERYTTLLDDLDALRRELQPK